MIKNQNPKKLKSLPKISLLESRNSLKLPRALTPGRLPINQKIKLVRKLTLQPMLLKLPPMQTKRELLRLMLLPKLLETKLPLLLIKPSPPPEKLPLTLSKQPKKPLVNQKTQLTKLVMPRLPKRMIKRRKPKNEE